MKDNTNMNQHQSNINTNSGSGAKHLSVFTVTEYEDKNGQGTKSSWTKVGMAWQNRDGSLNLKLDALPTNGKLHIREATERKEGARGGQFQFNQMGGQ
jgi:hypothetical protein